MLLLLLLLLLQETVDLEPIGSATVSRAGFRHADEEALLQPAGLARGPILLVDHTLAAVLAVGDAVHVVVRAPEEGLQQEATPSQLALMYRMRNAFAVSRARVRN